MSADAVQIPAVPVVHVQLFRKLAEEFMARVAGVPISGKVTQDKAALEFFCGAAAFAEVTGDKVSADAIAKMAWIISIRGYSHVVMMAGAK